MKNVSDDWFFQQHFDPSELDQIDKWNEVSDGAIVAQLQNGRFGGYHVEDKDRTILMVAMDDKEMCENWIKRMGFKLKQDAI